MSYVRNPIRSIVLAITLLTGMAAGIAPAESAPADRILSFPEESLGRLSLCPWEDKQGAWTEAGEAKGAVNIPAGKQLRLEVKKNIKNISSLNALDPEALQALSFNDTPMKPAVMEAILHFRNLRQLEFKKIRVDASVLKELSALKKLSVLRIEESGMNDDWLKPLKRFHGLTELALPSVRVTDKGIEPIARLKNLQVLDLSETRITDKGLKSISGLKHLKKLNLSNTAVTDTGITELASLKGLEKLSVPGSVSPKALESLKGTPAYAALGALKTFRLTIADADTGEALRGVTVNLSSDPDLGIKALTSNEKGLCEFLLPERKMEYLLIKAQTPHYVPIQIVWRKESTLPESHTLSLPKGTSIGATVVDENDQPVSNVKVDLLIPSNDSDKDGFAIPYLEDCKIHTDAQGLWQCDILPKDLNDIWIKLSHPDYVSDPVYGATPAPSIAQLRDKTGKMVLKRGILLSGRITDTSGNPLEGVRVAQGADRFGSDYPETRTDKEGRFQFKNAPMKEIILTVQKEGYAPDLRNVTADKTIAEADFTLEPGKKITGRVVNREGKPLADVWVVADTWRNSRTLRWDTHTDSEGRFHWDSAPADAVAFDILKEGYMANRKFSIAPGDTESVATLNNPLEISGAVTDAETGKPIPSFQIQSGVSWGNQMYWHQHIIASGSDGKYTVTLGEPYPLQALRISAEGYLPADTRGFKEDEGKQTFDLKLTKSSPITGTVYGTDGKPAAGATVYFCTGSNSPYLDNGNIHPQGCRTTTTNEQGCFSFNPTPDPYFLLMVNDQGITWASQNTLEKKAEIRIKPWTRVEGTLRIGSGPGIHQKVSLASYQPDDLPEVRINYSYTTETDDKGAFVFDRVIPGTMQLCRLIARPGESGGSYSHGIWLTAEAGKTTHTDIGGTGRLLKGKITATSDIAARVNWKYALLRLATEQKAVKPPQNLPNEKKKEWYQKWQQSEEGKQYRKAFRSYAACIDDDGNFELSDIPPGEYTINITAFETPVGLQCGYGKEIGRINKKIAVPKNAESASETPIDLGSFEIAAPVKLVPGKKAPDFKVKTLNGKTISLADYRGKYVLLDFWATWCGPCIGEIPNLKEVYKAFGAHPKFAMISLSLDEEMEDPKKYTAENDIKWEQGFLGKWSECTVTKEYGVEGIPSIFLIDPEGNILCENLRDAAILEAIKKYVK